MIYGYIRVSTDKQTSENQMLEIKKYAESIDLHDIQWIDETISGTKDPSKRKLGKLLDDVKEDDIIIVSEISRFGRSVVMIFNILDILLKKKVKVHSIKENFNLDNSIGSKAIMFAFGLSAEIERQLISDRTKAGLVRARQQGKIIGRPVGRKSSIYKLTGKEDYITSEIYKGKSKSELAKELHVTWTTLNNYIKNNQIA